MRKSVAILVLASSSALALEPSAMSGKTKTERTVRLEAEVACSPRETYALWTTADGLKQFFAPDARIDPRPGGEYTVLFFPQKDPEGLSHGTSRARVLKAIPGQTLWFEWITFAGDDLLGRNAPPMAPRGMRDITPLPTWVELELSSAANKQERTRINFAHYGFKNGALWEESHQWFGRAWARVLNQLEKYCAGAK